VGSEFLSCHHHPWTWIQMLLLKLKEALMTENKHDCNVLLYVKLWKSNTYTNAL
jgi:hypothetical protein